MKTRRTSTKLAVSVVALLLLGTTIVGVTQRSTPSVTRVPICVKGNGQLRMLTGNNTACGPSEQQVDWVVGGEVTDIRAGRGLVGSREDGTVQLAIDPSIIESCRSCDGGKVFAGFNDGPGNIPSIGLFDELPQIAKLDLPAGDYAIFTKMTLRTTTEGGLTRHVVCRLEAGFDTDAAGAKLEPAGSTDQEGLINELGMTLQVVHHFDEPGSAVLKCGVRLVSSGYGRVRKPQDHRHQGLQHLERLPRRQLKG